MNFLRLHDPLLSILYEDDDIVAVDKPYGISTHTNDSKVGNIDFIQHGLIELYESQLKRSLHIVHRLDQTTTGAIVFAKNQESADRYRTYFRNRETRKTYLFLTGHNSNKSELTSEMDIDHKGAKLEARTDFKLEHRLGKFELWSARPHTGRNHQIRIHASSLQIPVLGDTRYGGNGFPFLCLHNKKIEFPNGVVVAANEPAYFSDLSLLENEPLVQALFEVDRRQRMFSQKTDSQESFRLMHHGGKTRVCSLDHYGKTLWLASLSDSLSLAERTSFKKLASHLRLPLIERFGQSAVAEINKDIPMRWIVAEGRLRHEVRQDSGKLSGLPLDQRLQRSWVLENSKDKSVLNIFSHTCVFSTAAVIGGAQHVTSVDTSKTALEWGRRNFEINDIDSTQSSFLCRDALQFLQQCQKKALKFNLIICDAPTFSRGERGNFKIESDLEQLLQSCFSCLTENGKILFSTHTEKLRVDDIRQVILKVKAAMRIPNLEVSYIQAALDFELPGERTLLKSFLLSLGPLS